MLSATRVFLRGVTVIGFTGTIASGKTARCHRLVQDAINVQLAGSSAAPLSAAEALAAASTKEPGPPIRVGVRYLNADLVGHDIYLPGKPCYNELVAYFGRGILQPPSGVESTTTIPSGGNDAHQPLVNRRALGAIVFADSAKLHELNGICWPHISSAIAAQVADAEAAALGPLGQRHLLLVIEAALLLDMGATFRLCTDVWLTHCDADTAVARVQSRDGVSAEEARRRVTSQAGVEAKRRQLAEAGFTAAKGSLELFDTAGLSLEEGLRVVDERFSRFWDARLRQHIQ